MEAGDEREVLAYAPRLLVDVAHEAAAHPLAVLVLAVDEEELVRLDLGRDLAANTT